MLTMHQRLGSNILPFWKQFWKKHILSQNNRLVTQTDSERGTLGPSMLGLCINNSKQFLLSWRRERSSIVTSPLTRLVKSKSWGRWARQRPRRRVRVCDEFGGKGLVRDHGRGERSMYNILSRVTFLCLRVQHHHHRHQNLLQGWLSILLLS